MTGDKVNGITQGLDLASASDIAKFAAYSGAQGATQAGLSTLLQGGGLKENLNQALVSQLQSTLQAIAFNAVGDFSQSQNWPESGPEKVALHALVGGLVSEAGGGSFATGALAAGANEALVTSLAHAVEGNPALLLAASQLVGIAAAGATEGDVQKGAEIAKNATAYNYLNHHEVDDLVKDLKGCRGAENPAACRADLTLKYEGISDQKSGMDLMHCTDVASCDAQRSLIAVGNAALDKYESSGALNWEERLIVRGFLDSNQDDMRLAVQKTLQGTHAEIAGMLPGVGLVVGKGGTSTVGSVGAKATSIEFLPKATRNSAGQIEANITQGSAIKTLESNGYKKTISQDGSVTVLTNGEKTYRFYPSSTSTGQPSASLTIEGVKKPTAKIRFSGE